MLHISTWLWGTRYPQFYVDRLRNGVARHMQSEYRWHVFSPEPEDEHLKIGCLCRVRAFDTAWQAKHGIKHGDRVVNIDLDAIVTGPLDDLFFRAEEFSILAGANSSNPCRFNGSIWMLRAGYREDVWTDLSLDAAEKVRHASFPDDQSWFDHKFPETVGWKAGPQAKIYAFGKPGWPKGTDLPKDARLVAFPGWRDPSKFTHLGWVKEHWR